VNIIVGQSQFSTFRDGDALNAGFNNPSAIVLYNSTSFPNPSPQNYTVQIFNSNSVECSFADEGNYTLCTNEKLTEGLEINKNLIKIIYQNKLENKDQINTNTTSTEPQENQFNAQVGMYNNKLYKYSFYSSQIKKITVSAKLI
jgi:hypothetical protein